MTATASEWRQTAIAALRDVEALTVGVDDSFLPTLDDLMFPSLNALIERELTKPLEEVRELSDIKAERQQLLEQAGLASFKLTESLRLDSKTATAIRSRLPNMNLRREKPPAPLFSSYACVRLTVEVHASKHPWTSSTIYGAKMQKSLQAQVTRVKTLDIRGDATVQDLRTAIGTLPVDRNYDGPNYQLGSLIVLGKSVFRETAGSDQPPGDQCRLR